jgi:hypothetical protein
MYLKKLISFYQVINPFKGTCRYSPTCSEYTRQAIQKHGTIRGLWMGVKRVLRCNPFFIGGVDPVK